MDAGALYRPSTLRHSLVARPARPLAAAHAALAPCRGTPSECLGRLEGCQWLTAGHPGVPGFAGDTSPILDRGGWVGCRGDPRDERAGHACRSSPQLARVSSSPRQTAAWREWCLLWSEVGCLSGRAKAVTEALSSSYSSKLIAGFLFVSPFIPFDALRPFRVRAGPWKSPGQVPRHMRKDSPTKGVVLCPPGSTTVCIRPPRSRPHNSIVQTPHPVVERRIARRYSGRGRLLVLAS